MKRRIRLKGWIAAVAAAGVLAAGCGVRTDTPVESGATAPVETPETETSEPEKPTHPQPDTIEPFPTEPPETETVAEKPKGATRVVLMTDMHYLAGSLRDEGEAFTSMVDHGDGKLVRFRITSRQTNDSNFIFIERHCLHGIIFRLVCLYRIRESRSLIPRSSTAF